MTLDRFLAEAEAARDHEFFVFFRPVFSLAIRY